MKYLKDFKTFEKQLTLFPEKDSVQDVARKFVQHYKQKDKNIRYIDLKTISDVLNKYDNKDKFNDISAKIIVEENDEYNSELLANDYINNNPNILIKYFEENLENINKKFTSRKNFGTYFTDNVENPTIEYLENLYSEYVENNAINLEDLENDNVIRNPKDLIYYIIMNYNDKLDYYNLLDRDFWIELIDSLNYTVDEFGFDDKIPVYRKVTIPKNIDDLEKVITNYNGVGNYWTYEEDKAEAYNASNITNSQDITMKAYVNVSDVDWEITFDRTVYNLREEREIYIKDNSTVELFGIQLHSKEEELNKQKEDLIDYFDDTYGLGYNDINNMRINYEKENKEKSNIVFDPPIIIKV